MSVTQRAQNGAVNYHCLSHSPQPHSIVATNTAKNAIWQLKALVVEAHRQHVALHRASLSHSNGDDEKNALSQQQHQCGGASSGAQQQSNQQRPRLGSKAFVLLLFQDIETIFSNFIAEALRRLEIMQLERKNIGGDDRQLNQEAMDYRNSQKDMVQAAITDASVFVMKQLALLRLYDRVLPQEETSQQRKNEVTSL